MRFFYYIKYYLRVRGDVFTGCARGLIFYFFFFFSWEVPVYIIEELKCLKILDDGVYGILVGT
jgi:hypothetical protein